MRSVVDEQADEPRRGNRQGRGGQVEAAAARHLPEGDSHENKGYEGSHTIDVCAKNEPWYMTFAAESGLSLGALGPMAAQRSIKSSS